MQLLIDKLEKYEQILKPKTHRGSSQGSIDSESVDLSENDETSEAIETALAKQDKLTDNELIKLALHFKRSTAKCQYESAKFRTRIEVLEFQLAKYKDNQQPNDKTKQNQGANREKEFEVLIVKMKKRLKEQEDQISTSQQKIEDLKQDLADAKEENTQLVKKIMTIQQQMEHIMLSDEEKFASIFDKLQRNQPKMDKVKEKDQPLKISNLNEEKVLQATTKEAKIAQKKEVEDKYLMIQNSITKLDNKIVDLKNKVAVSDHKRNYPDLQKSRQKIESLGVETKQLNAQVSIVKQLISKECDQNTQQRILSQFEQETLLSNEKIQFFKIKEEKQPETDKKLIETQEEQLKVDEKQKQKWREEWQADYEAKQIKQKAAKLKEMKVGSGKVYSSDSSDENIVDEQLEIKPKKRRTDSVNRIFKFFAFCCPVFFLASLGLLVLYFMSKAITNQQSSDQMAIDCSKCTGETSIVQLTGSSSAQENLRNQAQIAMQQMSELKIVQKQQLTTLRNNMNIRLNAQKSETAQTIIALYKYCNETVDDLKEVHATEIAYQKLRLKNTIIDMHQQCNSTVDGVYQYCNSTVEGVYGYCNATVDGVYGYCNTTVANSYDYCNKTVDNLKDNQTQELNQQQQSCNQTVESQKQLYNNLLNSSQLDFADSIINIETKCNQTVLDLNQRINETQANYEECQVSNANLTVFMNQQIEQQQVQCNLSINQTQNRAQLELSQCQSNVTNLTQQLNDCQYGVSNLTNQLNEAKNQSLSDCQSDLNETLQNLQQKLQNKTVQFTDLEKQFNEQREQCNLTVTEWIAKFNASEEEQNQCEKFYTKLTESVEVQLKEQYTRCNQTVNQINSNFTVILSDFNQSCQENYTELSNQLDSKIEQSLEECNQTLTNLGVRLNQTSEQLDQCENNNTLLTEAFSQQFSQYKEYCNNTINQMNSNFTQQLLNLSQSCSNNETEGTQQISMRIEESFEKCNQSLTELTAQYNLTVEQLGTCQSNYTSLVDSSNEQILEQKEKCNQTIEQVNDNCNSQISLLNATCQLNDQNFTVYIQELLGQCNQTIDSWTQKYNSQTEELQQCKEFYTKLSDSVESTLSDQYTKCNSTIDGLNTKLEQNYTDSKALFENQLSSAEQQLQLTCNQTVNQTVNQLNSKCLQNYTVTTTELFNKYELAQQQQYTLCNQTVSDLNANYIQNYSQSQTQFQNELQLAKQEQQTLCNQTIDALNSQFAQNLSESQTECDNKLKQANETCSNTVYVSSNETCSNTVYVPQNCSCNQTNVTSNQTNTGQNSSQQDNSTASNGTTDNSNSSQLDNSTASNGTSNNSTSSNSTSDNSTSSNSTSQVTDNQTYESNYTDQINDTIPEPEGFVRPNCSAPEFYIRATLQCEVCLPTQTSGYINATQACLSCPQGQFYDSVKQVCFKCETQNQILTVQDGKPQCLTCPLWQQNNGDNQCTNICPDDFKWNGEVCKPKSEFINVCEQTSSFFYEKRQPNLNQERFLDNCDHTCHQIEIYTNATSGNDFTPIQISCLGDKDFIKTRGSQDGSANGPLIIGEEDSCIYRAERQGPADNITAIRYYWFAERGFGFTGNTYQVRTVGNYLYGAPTVNYTFKGCIQGFNGKLPNDDSGEMDIGFTYSYPNAFQCATDDTNSEDRTCSCSGVIYYGPLYGHDPSVGAISFQAMKNWFPEYKQYDNRGSLYDQQCAEATFNYYKDDPSEIFQCFCEEI